MNSKSIHEWVERHRISKFEFSYNKFIYSPTMPIPTNYVCDITIDLDQLQNIIKDEVDLIIESKIRENYPAVQKAYEQYQILLKLVQNGE